MVGLTPQRETVHLIQVGPLISVGDQAHHHCVICKLHNGVGGVCCHTVRGVEGVQQWTQYATLGGPCVECECVKERASDPHRLRSTCQKVLDPVTEGGVESQILEFGGQGVGDYGVES